VALATDSTVAVRTPEITSGIASGSSTVRIDVTADIPMPIAASRTAGSIDRIAASELIIMGGIASTTSAIAAAVMDSPRYGIRRNRIASVGTTRRPLKIAIAKRDTDLLRDERIPSGR
jgi:hypothetical protein